MTSKLRSLPPSSTHQQKGGVPALGKSIQKRTTSMDMAEWQAEGSMERGERWQVCKLNKAIIGTVKN